MRKVAYLLVLANGLVGCGGEPPRDLDALRVAWSVYLLPSSDELEAIPSDPLNPLTPDKVELGRLLFHDAGLLMTPRRPEGMGTASCATCHAAETGFQAGLRQGIGEGGVGFRADGRSRGLKPGYDASTVDVQPIRSPTVLNSAWLQVALWDGRLGAGGPNLGTEESWTPGTPKVLNRLGYSGVETQAIAALGVHRMDVDSATVTWPPAYTARFARAFPERAPEERITTETVGLAIAAYERSLVADQAPFQRWLRGDDAAITELELEGARLFFGKAGCTDCHFDPSLGSNTFHALGMDPLLGRDIAVSDPSAPEHRGRGAFTGRPEDLYAFKTPQLYNLQDVPFLGHGATFRSVREVIEYKNLARPEDSTVFPEEFAPQFLPLGLSAVEVDALVAFIEGALYDPALARYIPGSGDLPGDTCVPAADLLARRDLGCAPARALNPVDLSGARLVNEEHVPLAETYTFPDGTVLAPGEVLVLARSAARAEFEAYWGPLPPGARYLSADQLDVAPIINGGERFSLELAPGVVADGPTAPGQLGQSHVRVILEDPEDPSRCWRLVPAREATPGVASLAERTAGLYISEFADAEGDRRFEFVELAYSAE